MSPKQFLDDFVNNLDSVDVELGYKYHGIIRKVLSNRFYNEAKYAFKRGNKIDSFVYTLKSIYYNPFLFVKLLTNSFID